MKSLSQVIQKKIGDSLWRIQGAASLDEVAEELDVELPLDEYDTFGGYVRW